jgi:hypothetical protein
MIWLKKLILWLQEKEKHPINGGVQIFFEKKQPQSKVTHHFSKNN